MSLKNADFDFYSKLEVAVYDETFYLMQSSKDTNVAGVVQFVRRPKKSKQMVRILYLCHLSLVPYIFHNVDHHLSGW